LANSKTGVTVPGDIKYLPYDESPATPSKPKPAKAKGNTGGGGGKSPYTPAGKQDKLNREWGLSDRDHNLSADEQQNKLQGQLDEVDKMMNQENKSKEGLENLVRFYASDPVAQKKAEDEIIESEGKLQRLQEIRSMIHSQMDKVGGGGGGGQKVQVKCLYDYTATCDTELSFKEGDVLSVTEQDESGWWYAEIRGQSGFVPNNYVELVTK